MPGQLDNPLDGRGATLISQEAARDMLAALRRLDASWIEDVPGGPDGDGLIRGGFGRLTDDTVALWRDIRAAIAKAEGR